MKILAIETSCDETSVAVVENGKSVLSNIISTRIDIHKEYGGVVPEIASRHHIANILPVYEEALEKANCKIEDINSLEKYLERHCVRGFEYLEKSLNEKSSIFLWLKNEFKL